MARECGVIHNGGMHNVGLLTGEGAVQSISHDEAELLLHFRALSAAGRQYLLSRARAMHKEERGDISPSNNGDDDHPPQRPERGAH